MRRWVLFFVALVLGTALDLGTKAWAFEALARERTRPFNDWFAFTLATNKGAAFGMFWDRFEFFMAVTVVALVGLPYFVHTAPRRALALPTVLGLILSGVVGNFWDRVIHGHVRDFLDVHTPPAGALHDLAVRLTGRTVWPTFNVADIFITGGALILVVALGRDAPAAAPPPAAPSAGPEGPPGEAAGTGGGAVAPAAAPPVSG